MIVSFIFYTNYVIKNIKKEIEIVPDLYSKFISLPQDVNLEHYLFQYFMDEIIPKVDYPIILTDSLKTPFSWQNIDVPQLEFEKLEKYQKIIIQKMMRKMVAHKSVIPLIHSKKNNQIYGYIYYGDSAIVVRLKQLPYVGMGLIFIFIFWGFYGMISIKKDEQNIIWVGLAKETAHQFGTPLSSLSGWLNILLTKLEKLGIHDDFEETLNYMNYDLNKLNKIASRFGKVGSTIKFQNVILADIITETIADFRRKLPEKIELHFQNNIDNKMVNLDPDLMKWTFENLIKNALDAMQNRDGNIKIETFSQKNKIIIHIKDEGTGMTKSMFKEIFQPGATSKKRGWGLGLSLAKRIIQKYHHGNIRVLKSEVEIGTTFEISLPEV